MPLPPTSDATATTASAPSNLAPPRPATSLPAFADCQAGWDHAFVDRNAAQALLPEGFTAVGGYPGVANAWLAVTACADGPDRTFFGWTSLQVTPPGDGGVQVNGVHFYVLEFLSSPERRATWETLGMPLAIGDGQSSVSQPVPGPAFRYQAAIGEYSASMVNGYERSANSNGEAFNETDAWHHVDADGRWVALTYQSSVVRLLDGAGSIAVPPSSALHDLLPNGSMPGVGTLFRQVAVGNMTLHEIRP